MGTPGPGTGRPHSSTLYYYCIFHILMLKIILQSQPVYSSLPRAMDNDNPSALDLVFIKKRSA